MRAERGAAGSAFLSVPLADPRALRTTTTGRLPRGWGVRPGTAPRLHQRRVGLPVSCLSRRGLGRLCTGCASIEGGPQPAAISLMQSRTGVLLGKPHPRVRLRAVTAGVCSIARLTEQESAGEAADSMRLLVRRVVAYNSTQAGMQPAQRCP